MIFMCERYLKYLLGPNMLPLLYCDLQLPSPRGQISHASHVQVVCSDSLGAPWRKVKTLSATTPALSLPTCGRCLVMFRWPAWVTTTHCIHGYHPELVPHVGGQGQQCHGVPTWDPGQLHPAAWLFSVPFKFYNIFCGEKGKVLRLGQTPPTCRASEPSINSGCCLIKLAHIRIQTLHPVKPRKKPIYD